MYSCQSTESNSGGGGERRVIPKIKILSIGGVWGTASMHIATRTSEEDQELYRVWLYQLLHSCSSSDITATRKRKRMMKKTKGEDEAYIMLL